MIQLRQATMHDSDFLFAWRNDPATLAASLSTAAVPREDHDQWMQLNVAHGYPLHLVLMAEGVLGAIGVVRFDTAKRDVMTFNVSMTLAPQHRGKGMAAGILDQACGLMSEYRLDAAIRSNNKASQRVFERCGFEALGDGGGFFHYRKQPQ